MNKFIQNVKNAEGLVKLILKMHPDTRGDDKKLILMLWEFQGLKLTDEQKQMFMKVMPPETIRRCRQKIQEYGFFRPDPETYFQRKLLGEDTRREI